MNEQNESASVNPSLLAINQQTFVQGRYETAYYCLIAALHHACDLDNPETLQPSNGWRTNRPAYWKTAA